MHYDALDSSPVEAPEDLAVGDRILLGGSKRTWRISAVSEHFAAAVQNRFGHMTYTVLDWHNGVRGPCDLIGQGYGDGTYSEEECAEMLLDFEWDDEQDPARLEALARGETSWVPARFKLHVSQRNWVPIDNFTVKTKAA